MVPASALRVDGLQAGYGATTVLHGVSLEVAPGNIVAMIGANGVGKTTFLRAVSGLLRPSAGEIHIAGERTTGLPAEDLVPLGVAHIPEGRQLFSGLTVRHNLLIGAFARRERAPVTRDFDRVLELFPELRPLLNRQAGTLSGGEQQMVAIGRGLMTRPRLLLIDEFSLGLAPVVVDRLARLIRQVHAGGEITIILVEQDAQMALEITNWAFVLAGGRIAAQGPSGQLLADDNIRRIYLGV